mgnify:CR=1 FL=1
MDGAPSQTILIVDDDRGLVRLIQKGLQREGFKAATACSGEEAVEWLSNNHADLLLLDLKLQDVQGKELVRQLSEKRILPPFIIITGQGDERVAVDMMKIGARDYLIKDVEFLQLVPEVVRNVLEQIETERRLAAAEEQVNLVQNVVEHGFSAVLIANADLPDPHVLYINPAFAKLTGSSSRELIGKPLSSLRGFSVLQQRLTNADPGQDVFLNEESLIENGGMERWVEWRVGPVRGRSGQITHWLVILRDTTERKRLEKEILEINDRVQRRIGHDLHDGLCQQLAGIELMCQVLEQKIAAKSKSDAATIRDIAGHVRDAIGQTRLMARGLSPIVLESEGLMSGLQELALNTEKIFHVQCVFESRSPVLLDDHAAATHLFRIAQEAVSNAVRHGKAKHIVIRLSHEGGSLTLTIRDDGSGLKDGCAGNSGMGLRIMRSRAETIGGTVAVENNPQGGVCVTCTVALPIAARNNKDSRGHKEEKSKIQTANPHR